MAYVFDPETLHACTHAGIGPPVEEGMNAITRALDDAYPGKINTKPRRWFFNNAGGAMGQMCMLYASLREYIIFFGTPIGTDGHSGRYRADVHDYVFAGEMWCYLEGETGRRVYKAGDAANLGPGQAKGYRIPDFCWMLEYARGNTAAMLPFAVMDTFTSTLDFTTLKNTFKGYQRVLSRSFRK